MFIWLWKSLFRSEANSNSAAKEHSVKTKLTPDKATLLLPAEKISKHKFIRFLSTQYNTAFTLKGVFSHP